MVIEETTLENAIPVFIGLLAVYERYSRPDRRTAR